MRAQRLDSAANLANSRRDVGHGKTANAASFQLDLELGRTYLRLSDPRQALTVFQQGLERGISADLLVEYSAAYRDSGDQRQAIVPLIEASLIGGNNPGLSSRLVELYRQIDPQGCSVCYSGGPPSLDMNCPLVHKDLCTAYRNLTHTYHRLGYEHWADQTRQAASGLGCAVE